MKTETLAPDVGWEPSGCLSDVALSAAADGEEGLLDAEMQGHLGSCDGCAMKLGRMALRSAEIAEMFAHRAAREAAAEAPAPVIVPAAPRPRRKPPVFALAAALVVALLGVAPSLSGASWRVMHTWTLVQKLAPSFVRLLPLALGRAWSGPAGPLSALVWCMAIALALAGLTIARKASKKALLDGGRR